MRLADTLNPEDRAIAANKINFISQHKTTVQKELKISNGFHDDNIKSQKPALLQILKATDSSVYH